MTQWNNGAPLARDPHRSIVLLCEARGLEEIGGGASVARRPSEPRLPIRQRGPFHCRWHLYRQPDNGGYHTGRKQRLYAFVDPVSPPQLSRLACAGGGGAGYRPRVRSVYCTRVYRHSRRTGALYIGVRGKEMKHLGTADLRPFPRRFGRRYTHLTPFVFGKTADASVSRPHGARAQARH